MNAERKINSSSQLLKFLSEQMLKLEAGQITVEESKAQAALCKQANNLLNYEINRANHLAKHGNEFLRDIENE